MSQQILKAIILLKSHIDGYTKKDGTFVAPHEDKRKSAKEALQRLQKKNPHFEEFTGDEDFDDNSTPNAFRAAAAIHELKNLGWQIVNGDTAGYGDSDMSHYIKARKVVETDPEYGDEHVTIKVRIANHSNTTKLGHDKPDVNIAPGADIVSDLEEKLNDKLKDEGYPQITKSILFFKSHPTPAQIAVGNYKKPRIKWNGLEIAIENPAGSIRSGIDPKGEKWSVKMKNAYGYICRTQGIDGDGVDVFIGPDMDAPMVYVVHQKKVDDWEHYDEDKCMLGWPNETAARQAFLDNYDDPRFLGPITAMPVAEFVDKARATYDHPKMIKAILFVPRP